jgi:hypothetical protein
MFDLLADPQQTQALINARLLNGLDPGIVRRMKVLCSFQYPNPAAADRPVGTSPIRPLIPVVLARSFDIDGSQTSQLDAFSKAYAEAIQAWSTDHQLSFGPGSQPDGAQFVFDITLYAQLSGLNTPVLRLSNLQLKLADIGPLSV